MTCGSLWCHVSIGAPLECMVIGRRSIRRSSSKRDCERPLSGSRSWRLMVATAHGSIRPSHEARVEETRPGMVPWAEPGAGGGRHEDGIVLQRSNWTTGTASFSAIETRQLYIWPETTTICSGNSSSSSRASIVILTQTKLPCSISAKDLQHHRHAAPTTFVHHELSPDNINTGK